MRVLQSFITLPSLVHPFPDRGGPPHAGHCYAPCEQPKYKSLPFCDKQLSLDARVADAVRRLSLGEKISNTMASASNGWSEHGGFPSIGMPQQTTSEALHGVMESCLPLSAYPNATSYKSVTAAAFATNGGTGCATSFPVGITLGATYNTTLFKLIGQAIGTEGRAYHNLRAGEHKTEILATGRHPPSTLPNFEQHVSLECTRPADV